MPFEVLAQELGHLHEMPEHGLEPRLAEEAVVGEGGEGTGPGPRGLQGVHPGPVVAEVIEVGHLLRGPRHQLQIVPVRHQHEAGDVGGEAGLVEVDAEGVGQRQVAYAPAGAGQGAHGAGRNPRGLPSKS